MSLLEERLQTASSDRERLELLLPLYDRLNHLNKGSPPRPKDAARARVLCNEAQQADSPSLALLLYTKSIAIAPVDSDILVTAFGQRSKLLDPDTCNPRQTLDITSLSNCFSHIELLSKETESNDSTPLELISHSAVKMRQNATENIISGRNSVSSATIPTLTHGPNREAPCMSEAVTIMHSSQFGRHLVATQDLKPGEVLVVEPAVAAVLEPARQWSHCSHCLRPWPALMPCPTCSWALYCSVRCRREAAALYHSAECPALNNYLHSTEQVNLAELHMIRIIATVGIQNLNSNGMDFQTERTKGFNINGQLISNNPQTLLSLSFHVQNRPIEEIISAGLLAFDFLSYFTTGDTTSDTRLTLGTSIFQLFLRGESNAHSLVEVRDRDKLVHLGAGIFVCSSLINHSCDPNVFRVNHGSTLVHRATRPVSRGTQLTVSYGVQFDTRCKEERTEYLRKYRFECSCEACLSVWPTRDSLPDGPLFSHSEHEAEQEMLHLTRLISDMNTDSQLQCSLYKRLISLLFENNKRLNKLYIDAEKQLRKFYRLES